MKPIIIDDEPTVIDLDTKIGIDAQVHDATVPKTPNGSIGPGNRGVLHPSPIVRPLPKPPELTDKRVEPKQSIGPNPNMDFEKKSPHQEALSWKCI